MSLRGNFVEGYAVFKWQEFKALCDRLSIDLAKLTNTFTLCIKLDDAQATSEHKESITPLPLGTTDGYAIYHWPEFKALCDRLGIAWEQPTTILTIRLSEGEPPKITHEYNGRDFAMDLSEVYDPQISLSNRGG